MQETQVRSLDWEDPLQKRIATLSSILAWRIPWREEPGGLQSMGLQRVGPDGATNMSTLFSSSSYCPRQNRKRFSPGVEQKSLPTLEPESQVFCLLLALQSIVWDFSSLSRDRTHAPCMGSLES